MSLRTMTDTRELPSVFDVPEPSLTAVERLMVVVKGQAGVFTTGQAFEAGVTRLVLDRLVGDGLVVREMQAVYRLAGIGVGNPQRFYIATLASGGTLSHTSAARLWGYRHLPEAPVHVTVARQRKAPSRPGLVVHSTSRQAADLAVVRSGLRVTRPLRTLLDLAGASGVEDEMLGGFLDHCIAEQLFAVRTLERFVGDAAVKQRGVVRLRHLLGGAVMIDSVAEGELLRVLAAAGIERPVAGLEIYGGGRFIGRADFAWEAQRLVLEMDGYAYHSSRAAFVADRERGNRLVAAGWMLLRVTLGSLRNHPEELCAAVKAALQRGSRRASA